MARGTKRQRPPADSKKKARKIVSVPSLRESPELLVVHQPAQDEPTWLGACSDQVTFEEFSTEPVAPTERARVADGASLLMAELLKSNAVPPPPPPPPPSRAPLDSAAILASRIELAFENPDAPLSSESGRFQMTRGRLDKLKQMREEARADDSETFRKPSSEALSVWFRSLSVLYKAAINVDRAFELLADQTECPRMSSISRDMARRVRSGSNLAQAAGAHAHAFSRLQVRLFQLGQRTGTLDAILEQIAVYEEKRRQTQLRVQGALIYPAFLFVLSCLLLVTVPPFLFQGVFEMISNSGVQPNALTRVVVAFANFVRTPAFWGSLLALTAGIGVAGRWLLPRSGVRRALDEFGLKIPVLGRVYRILATARFARALALQLHVGENVIAAVKLSAEASDHAVLTEAIDRSVAGLRDRGDTLVRSLARAKFFPKPFLQMLRAGEESAGVPTLMTRMAEIYEDELACSLETFLAMLEPLMMLFLGVMVGIIVIATMLPMMQVISAL